MFFLLNTPVLTDYGQYTFTGPIGIDQAKAWLRQPFFSAVGHDGAANFLSRLLAVNVPLNRQSIRMMPGDEALVLRLLERLPEGALLSADEIAEVRFELAWLRRDS